MKFNLSIVMDRYGNNREDLYTTNSLQEMDAYLLNFNRQEVRSLYKESIQEFLLDNKEFIRETEHKNKRLNNGHICITFYDKKGIIRMVPVIYKDVDKLLNKRECYKKIKVMLNQNSILKELYNRKEYLLVPYERDLLREYFMFPVSYKKYKTIMVDNFIDRISNMEHEREYLYLRSLMNICDLREKANAIPIKRGVIREISDNIPLNTSIVKTIICDDCSDEFFIRLMEEKNYEELHHLYDIETIEKYSNYYKKK